MRRVSIKVAAFVPLLIAGLNAWAIEEVNGVYQIGSPQDLTEFAELVNSGNTGANACLTADIDLSGVENFTPIGAHYTTPYVGIFDGQGHTISNLKIERNELAETGLFYRICGTVQNLGIVNATVKNPSGWRVGVIGGCSAGGTLINCFTAGDIVLENGQIGGLCGLLQNTTIKSCYTTFSKIGDSEDGTTAENCYWGDGVVSMAPTGELCYKMNGEQKEITWYQTLGEDAYPLVDSTHKQVYAAGDLNCNGQVKAGGTLTYSNTKTQEIPDHHFVDGICTECGQADPGFIQVVDGWYEVGKPEQLMYVSDLVNSGKQNINVRLTADIDLSGITYFPPIGRLCWPGGPMLHYGGTFDGQGHIIYNLSIDKEDAGAETGLFGRLDGATVQNLGIVNATFKNSSALRAGVLAGGANNSRITNCFTTGEFVMDECICTFDTKNGDGMFGLFTGTTASNCYTTHSTFGDHEGSTLNNCYWGESAIGMAPTGELCYKLNGDQSTIAWFQTLGEDAYPVPNAAHSPIYVIGEMNCAGNIISENVSYTNDKDAASQIPPHHFVDGICTECGQPEPGYVQLVDGWYEVGTPEQLLYISGLVNSGKPDINIRLTADIDLTDITYFPPIGRLNHPQGPMMHYGGTFDGQGHIIYNLTIDKEDEGAETGLFGRLIGATIQNLGIVNATFRNPTALRAGVLAGCSNNAHITRCFTAGNIAMDECICAFNARNGDGLIGLIQGGTVTDCYTTYATIGANEGSTLDNCYWGEEAVSMAPTGELCYKMNGSSFFNPQWYQTIGEDAFPVLDSGHGVVYRAGDEYSSFQDEASFARFREMVVEAERDLVTDATATQSVLDDCAAALEALAAISGREDFLTAYSDYLPLKNILMESVAAYAAYKQKAQEVAAFLEENETLQGALRDRLDSYLQDDMEPDDIFAHGSYSYIMEHHTLTTDEIQAETALLQAMLEEALAADYARGTDITRLLKNGDFRDGWNGWDGTLGTGRYFWEDKDIVGCEGWNSEGRTEQTVEGLKEGMYMVTMTAAYCPSNDPSSYAYNAYVRLNDNCVFIPTVRETYMPVEEAADGVNCNLSIPYTDAERPVTDEDGNLIGYAIGGTPGIAIAAAAGRSVCCMVANVTDGKLTLGVENPGSKYGSDWTGWANIHLTYLGTLDEADEQLDAVLAGQTARACTLTEKYEWVLDNYYPKCPNFSQTLREELAAEIAEAETASSPEAKYAVVERFSQTFRDIYTSKRQYVEVLNKVEELTSLVYELYPGLIESEDYEAFTALSDAAWTNYENGTLDYEATMAQIQALGFNPQMVDGWYEVSSPAQLRFVAELVNGGKPDINVRLTADIDLSGISYFPPIGKLNYPQGPMLQFSGTFDGQGHIIRNLSIDMEDAGAETGLFGRLSGATIQNLGIVNATFKNSSALRAGVLAGCANNSRITNCFTAGEFVMDECVCRFNQPNGSGLCGLITSGAIISNCYTTRGTIGDHEGSTLDNCYWGEEAVSMAPTGELCYKLNGDQSTIVWFQTLSEDAYPVLDATHSVVVKNEDGSYGNITGVEEIHNAQFIMHNNDAIYDLSGRKVSKDNVSKGIYIIDGQKRQVK